MRPAAGIDPLFAVLLLAAAVPAGLAQVPNLAAPAAVPGVQLQALPPAVQTLQFTKPADSSFLVGTRSETVLHFSKPADPNAPDRLASVPRPQILQFEKRATVPMPLALPVDQAGRLPVPGEPSAILRTVLQQPKDDLRAPGEDTGDYQIQLEPPGPEKLFRLETEAALFERMRQEARERPVPERIEFPPEPVISRDVFSGRYLPPKSMIVEPAYVCYKRLYFEQKNYERYGWDFGLLTPMLSVGTFLADVALLPYNVVKEPCRRYECNAGYCLPGDPVPFRAFPLEWSLAGAIAEAGTILVLIVMFP